VRDLAVVFVNYAKQNIVVCCPHPFQLPIRKRFWSMTKDSVGIFILMLGTNSLRSKSVDLGMQCSWKPRKAFNFYVMLLNWELWNERVAQVLEPFLR
jgi:hypothetical protein